MLNNRLMRAIGRGMIAGTLLFGGITVSSAVMAPAIVYADEDEASKTASDINKSNLEAKVELSKAAAEATYSTVFELEDGGNISGADLWEVDDNGVFYPTNNVSRLSQDSKSKFIKMAYDASQQERSENPDINNNVVSTWWKRVQDKGGVGAQYMQQLIGDTKPDLVAGKAIWEPLEKPIGVVLGVGCIALFALLAISLLLDIFYITLPPVRMAMDGSGGQKKNQHGGMAGRGAAGAGGRGGANGPAYISAQAKNAVQDEAEGGSGLLSYFKNSAVKLVILALCLMFLISGKIYVVIGWILNLVASMFGFTSI